MNNVVDVDLTKEINPNFYCLWNTDKPYRVLKGGRSSFKSSSVALQIIDDLLMNYIFKKKKANVVVIRKVANTLRDSVYLKMQWAINKYGVLDQFKLSVSPLKIQHRETGSTIYFYGQDDFEKLKGNDINDLIYVWYEEASEFKQFEDFDQTNATFMRQKHEDANHVVFYWSYNPPRNPYSWINEWTQSLEGDKNYLVHRSSYLDDTLGFITGQSIEEIERIKNNDYDYYRYLYLGEPVGLGTNVYNMDLFNSLDKIPNDEHILYIFTSTDTGYSVSATTTSAFAYTNKGNVILLDTIYYNPVGKSRKRSAQEHSKVLHEFIEQIEKEYGKKIQRKTVDSADGAIRNQYFNDYSERLSPVAKKTKIEMTEYVTDLLTQGRFYYLNKPSNDIFVDEHKKYQWDERSIENDPDNPKVMKVDDHTCDTFQYFVVDNLRLLGLKY